MSNLYPLVQEARICLRCQYRLANYGAKRRKVQARSFSAQSQNFQEHARADDRASVRQDLFDVPTIPETLLDQSADDIELPKDARPARALEDLGYFFRSANLYSRDPLGRTTLGKPAEVLRLQDNPPRRRDRKWWQVDKEDDNISRSPEPLTSSDILDSVNTDRGLVSEARAIHNIDALKQDWQSRLKDQHLGPTESECDHLRKRAMLGFTRKQLLAYMKKASTLNPQDSTDLHHPFQSALYARSEWRVGVTAFPGDGARRLNDVSGSSWTRYKFVDKLMRQTWGIRSREELQSIGEVDVRIHEAHLYLLSSHNSGILRRIATEYDAKIDCSRVEHILRITANAATCASSLKLLSMVLDDIVCHKYSLGINSKSTRMPTATNEVFNDIQLREIERLSDTVVRWPQNDGGKIQHFPKLLIYYLGQDSKSLEAARRLLGQCRNPLREAKPDVFFAGDDAVFDALAPLPVEASKNLPLTDRGIAWTRLCSGSTESVTDGQAPPSALINVIEHIQPSDNYSTLHQLLGERWNWGIRCVQERSTVLGQLLYPAKTASSRKRSRWDLTQPHVMNTDVPSIRSEFGSLGQEMKLRQEVRIKLQATNGAVLKGAPIRHLPDLELRCVIQVDPDRPDEPSKVILDGVRLVLENRQADLLLPHEPMDMRFATQVYLDATAKPDPRILRFMESCNLSDPDLDPLVMPQSLTIGIPRQIMDPVPQADEKVIDKVSLRKYSLASVERFWILHSDRDGIKAAYSTIDAGAFGGRRQELRFSQCSVPEIKPPVDWLSRQTRSLYHYAYNMVQRTRVGQKMAANISRRDAVMDWVTPNEIERAELRQVGVRRVVSSRLPDFQRWPSIRHYATVESGDPKDPKKKDKASKKDDGEITDDGNKAGKPAPGFEQLYKDEGVMSSTSANGQNPNEPEGPRLTQREMEALDNLLRLVKKGMPTEQAKIIERAFADIKRDGIPQELREIIDARKNGKSLDIATMARLARVTSEMARKSAEKQVNRLEKESTNRSDTSGSSSSSDSGKKRDSHGEKGSASSFDFMDIKLDTQTLFSAAFVFYMLYRAMMPSENSKNITWQEFQTTFLSNGLVEKLTVINKSNVRVDLHREATAQAYPESPAQHANFHYYFTIGSVEALERNLDAAQQELDIPQGERIPVAYVNEETWLATLYTFAPLLLIVGVPYLLSRRTGGGMGSSSGLFGIGKSRAKKFNHETDVKVKFKDVAGMDEAKAEIMEFVSFLREPETYSRLGAKIPRGAILSGPPGTGKTLLAKATAGESGVPFFSVSGSEFVEMFVGVGPSRVRDLFANARKNTPCIIFVDEIDAIGKKRGVGVFGGDSEREATLNQILTEMDGFNTSEQVVVLAGTNRPDVLDGALMRPGRFDRHINIDAPTMEGRKQIFKVHVAKIITDENVEHMTGRLAALTPGFSGADIANCVNEAALTAARTNATKVVMKHFESAIERVIGGLENKSRVLNPTEKRTVAYHEAGHAICGWFFKHADPLLKVSIIPRGKALGYAQSLPDSENYLLTMHQLMDRMAMTLGGRVSEELHFDTVTSGASDDFNKVTRMATAMVTKMGMSDKIGYLYFEEDSQKLHKPFSEETARHIDQEVRRIVDEAYQQCKDLLTEKKREVGLVAEELLAKEVMVRDDLVRLLGKRPFGDNKEFSKYFDGEDGKSAPDVPPDVPPAVPPAPAM
ncbi:MAG: hypothetical protein LQ352_004099 [Teloschistes flavicans]|nr:MAG: hypothetical protein LQ352_004099 [Teloschistes flavicans]